MKITIPKYILIEYKNYINSLKIIVELNNYFLNLKIGVYYNLYIKKSLLYSLARFLASFIQLVLVLQFF